MDEVIKQVHPYERSNNLWNLKAAGWLFML